MRILIIEDEPIAASQLSALVLKLRPGWSVAGICDTVKSTVRWINENGLPDLAFFDIQLGDGLSFNVFEQLQFTAPVIFTTAFDEYAIRAFKVNSIDYLLKPIVEADMEKALQKFEKQQAPNHGFISAEIVSMLKNSLRNENYKKRYLVKTGDRLKSLDIGNVAYFYSMEKATFAKTTDGKDFLLDYSLDSIEKQVNPNLFFRINRKHMVSLTAITDVLAYSNSRLKLTINHTNNNDFLVAREKVKAFKNWLEGEA
jgi:DNA-binding LytR/AlgR family response regulator